MKKVYICAPLESDMNSNIQMALEYTEFALKNGAAPMPTRFYAVCLDDNNPKEREIRRSARLALLLFCDEMWIFGDTVTEEMQAEIRLCHDLKKKMRTVKPSEIKKFKSGGNPK